MVYNVRYMFFSIIFLICLGMPFRVVMAVQDIQASVEEVDIVEFSQHDQVRAAFNMGAIVGGIGFWWAQKHRPSIARWFLTSFVFSSAGTHSGLFATNPFTKRCVQAFTRWVDDAELSQIANNQTVD